MLSTQEELELARESKTDPAARTKFIESNLRLVASIAKRYYTGHIPYLDLIQEGNIGLIKAVDKFDPAYERKFSTYGTYWIKGAILSYINKHKKIKEVPTAKMEQNFPDLSEFVLASTVIHKIEKIAQDAIAAGKLKQRDYNAFKARVYLEYTLEEVAKELELTRERIRQIQSNVINTLPNNFIKELLEDR